MQEQFGNSPRIIDSGLPAGNTDPKILKPFVKGIATEKEKIEKLEQKKINELQRRTYASDPKAADKQRQRRHRREPNRAIRGAKNDFEAGLIDHVECARRISEAISDFERLSIVGRKLGRKKAE